ncbi:hypothetical protein C5167_037765 [Papaver somniferum]|uniref:Uncharacterized protein n=1 Tax=Papaver somniferum TaxID=3469 RepID=A0A4Y7IBP0_PAPSO|nr:uncharacterized protein LOC113290076 [Papaver somniferum]RZC44819.1 hypothetical protein C5167_037765 [Papaver somniferum]
MEANALGCSLISSNPSRFFHNPVSYRLSPQPHRNRRHQSLRIKAGPSGSNDSVNDGDIPPPPTSPITPPDTVEIRFRRGSRKRSKQEKLDPTGERPKPPKKEWEAMTYTEKAIELYMGEKGLLFWLNKFAYASIYIIIGAWILFRFVGPSLGFYQLDAPSLTPSDILLKP